MQNEEKPYTHGEKATIDKILKLWQIRDWTDEEIYQLITKLREIPDGFNRFYQDMSKNSQQRRSY